MKRLWFVVFAATMAAAQSQPMTGSATQWVRLMPPSSTTVSTGKPTKVPLEFVIDADKHINSNTPKSEFLIPTKLKLEAPTDVSVGTIVYPAGHDFAFSFAPDDKLNVYTGTFQVTASLLAAKNAPIGVQRLRGELQYQACNDRACFPPKKLPVEFDVRVVRSATPAGPNPRQSPHIHN